MSIIRSSIINGSIINGSIIRNGILNNGGGGGADLILDHTFKAADNGLDALLVTYDVDNTNGAMYSGYGSDTQSVKTGNGEYFLAKLSTTSTTKSLYFDAPSYADGTISVKVLSSLSNERFWLGKSVDLTITSFLPTGFYLDVKASNPATFTIRERSGGSLLTRASASWTSPLSVNDVVSLVVNGDTVTAYINGVEIVSYTGIDPANQVGTQWWFTPVKNAVTPINGTAFGRIQVADTTDISKVVL